MGSSSAGTFDMYQKIVESSGTGIIVIDYKSREVIYASGSVTSFFPEAAAKPIIGLHLDSLLPDIDPEAANALSERIRGDLPLHWEHYFRAYGREYIFNGKRTDFDGRDVFIIYMTDNTEAYKEKARIRNHYHSQITMMSGVSPYALAMYRLNLTQNLFNPQILGRTSDGLRNQIPNTVDEFFDYTYEHCGSLRDEKRFSSIFSRDRLLMSFSEGMPTHSLQHLYYMDENRPIWITTSVNMAKNPDTGDVEAVLYTVDTNREKITEEMLRTIAENDYERISLIDTCTGLRVSLFDLGRELTRNPLSLGVSYDRALETYFSEKQDVDNQTELLDSLRLANVIRQLEAGKKASGKAIYECTCSFFEKGRRRHKRLTFYSVNEAEKLICHTIQDITAVTEQEKEQQEKLEQAYQNAKNALDEKNVLLSRISRDIRTPLNAITGLTNLARAELTDNPVIERYLREIALSSANVRAIVDEILALRQIEKKQVLLQTEVVEIPAIVKGVENRMLPFVKEKNQTLTVDYRNLETKKVMVDRYRLEEILQKLLENASIYTREGGRIRLTVSDRRKDSHSVLLTFVISDNGVGMSEEKLRRHFGPTAETMDVDQKSDDRIGLGLAIVRNYVRAMEGDLRAVSREGQGSEITVTLPLDVPFLDISGKSLASESSNTFDFSGKHIMLVDDHRLSRQIGKKMLEKTGARTETAKNGLEAVKLFEESKGDYDLILMDIRMPEMDGLEACRTIRTLNLPTADTVPIIAMTADAFEEDIQGSFQAGMNAHLAKPIDPKILHLTLESFFHPKTS